MTDAELIIASREDPARFRELYDRLADDLLGYDAGCAIVTDVTAGHRPGTVDLAVMQKR